MGLNTTARHFEISPQLHKLIERQAAKVRKFLPTFSEADMDLNVSLERLPRGNQFQTVLVLTLPQTVIRVEDLQDNETRSVHGAFQELLRRVKRFKSRLNRERLWRRQTPTAPPETAQQPLDDGLSERLDKVEKYVRRELYHQVLAGRIPAGIIDPHALLDEIFVEAREQRDSDDAGTEQWLFRTAREKVQRRIRDLEDHRNDPHLEESVTPTQRDLEDEQSFFQPDEALHLEDLIQDHHSASPEELLVREEAAERLQRAVAHLPGNLRESFVLFSLEGFTSDEVAMITSRDPAQVLQEVEDARARLREEVNS